MKPRLAVLTAALAALALASLARAEDRSRVEGVARTSPTMAAILARGRIVAGGSFKFQTLDVSDPATGEHQGYLADIGRLLAARILGDPSRIEWRFAGGKDNFGNLRFVMRGDVDMIIEAVGVTDEKRKMVNFTDPVLPSGHALLVKKTSPIKSIADLKKGVRVSYINEASPAPVTAEDIRANPALLMAKAPDATYVNYIDIMDAIDAVANGDVEAFTHEATWLYDAASRHPDLHVVGRFSNGPYSMISRKDDPAFAAYLNDFVRELQASGELKRLGEKWLAPYGRI